MVVTQENSTNKRNAINSLRELGAELERGTEDFSEFGDVSVKIDGDLVLFSYTPPCNFKPPSEWNWLERTSRGLIMNRRNGEVVALPFPKFFNWGQGGLPGIKDYTILEVAQKYDGSLGILYRRDGALHVATRGSFDSDQAKWATERIQRDCPQLEHLPDSITLLFEIIYPENRVIVDYQGYEGLRIIGIRDRKTEIDYLVGAQHTRHEFDRFVGGPIVWGEILSMPVDPIEYWIGMANLLSAENDEGFVVRLSNGDRYKIKGIDYLTVHKILSRASYKAVVEGLQAGSYDAMRAVVFDSLAVELDEWHTAAVEAITHANQQVEEQGVSLSVVEREDREARKEVAQKITSSNLPKLLQACLFRKLDGQDYQDLIYKHVLEIRNV
jgi:RNA ligase